MKESYSYELLRAIIPRQNKPEPRPQRREPTSFTPSADVIPLYNCLSRKHRRMIDHGVAEGGRNSAGYSLACDLIGTAEELDSIGQPYSGTPEDYFDDFCDRCNPPIDYQEREKIWRSANSGNKKSCLTFEQIEVCIKAFQNKNKKMNELKNNRPAPTSANNLISVYGNTPDGKVATTSDHWFVEQMFNNGEGDIKVINNAFYRYAKGHWTQIQDEVILRQIANQLPHLYQEKEDKKAGEVYIIRTFAKNSNAESAFKYCQKSLSVGDKPQNNFLICFKNGTLDVRTKQLILHSKDHYLTAAIDAEYVQNAECPEVFRNFIHSSYGADQAELIQAIISMMIDPTAPYGKFPHFIGESGSGKGTLIRFLGSFHGEHFKAGTSFADLNSPDKRHQCLSGTALYAFPDMAGCQENLTGLYELVDNGKLDGRALFTSNNYSKQWNTRFLVGSVNPLQFSETKGGVKGGWHRRAIPIQTLGKPDNIDQHLEAKLEKPDVKAGVISWALSMNRDRRNEILKNPQQFDRVAAMQNKTELASDSVKTFVDECLRPSDSDRKYTPQEMYDFYKAFCSAVGNHSKNKINFDQDLISIIPAHHVDRRKARKSDGEVADGEGGWIRAGWINLRPIPQLFTATSEGIEIDSELLQEGGLYEFREFLPNYSEKFGTTGTTGVPNLLDPVVPSETKQNQGFQKSGTTGTTGTTIHTHMEKKSSADDTHVDFFLKAGDPVVPVVPVVPKNQNPDVARVSDGTTVNTSSIVPSYPSYQDDSPESVADRASFKVGGSVTVVDDDRDAGVWVITEVGARDCVIRQSLNGSVRMMTQPIAKLRHIPTADGGAS